MTSVVLATYNGAEFIEEQLRSILEQIGETDEVVISDDASTDGTLAIVERFGDKRIRVFHHEKKPHRWAIDACTDNFQFALSQARGEFIFLSDQDDVWMSEKISLFTARLQEADLVLSDCVVTDSQLSVVSPTLGKNLRYLHSVAYNLYKPSFLGSSMAFRRELLEEALPFPASGVGHDLWLGLVALMSKARIAYIDQPTHYYRRHKGVVTDGGLKNHTSLAFKLHYRWLVLRALMRYKWTHGKKKTT